MTTYSGHTVDGKVRVTYPKPGMMEVFAHLHGTDGWGWKWNCHFKGHGIIPEIAESPDIHGVVAFLERSDREWKEREIIIDPDEKKEMERRDRKVYSYPKNDTIYQNNF